MWLHVSKALLACCATYRNLLTLYYIANFLINFSDVTSIHSYLNTLATLSYLTTVDTLIKNSEGNVQKMDVAVQIVV